MRSILFGSGSAGLGIAAALFAPHRRSWGHTANTAGLVLSTIYLAWTAGAKLHVEQATKIALDRQQIPSTDVLTTPTPFNSLLWRILVVNDNHYYEGFFSVLDTDYSIRFEKYPRKLGLIEPLQKSWPVKRLNWFTKNFYSADLSGSDIVITDLRMGYEPEYVFRFKVGDAGHPHSYPVAVEQLPGIRNFERLGWVWARIWDRNAT